MRFIAAAALVMTAALFGSPAGGASPVGCGSLGGVVAGGLCRVTENQPTFTIDAEFPLDYPDE